MKSHALYLRTAIFGIIDSLVSTVGLLAGLSVGGASQATIILAGAVYASVEAFSMAVGNYLSEESAEEYVSKSEVGVRASAVSGVVMFFSSIFAALIPLFPYLLFTPKDAFFPSVSASIVALFFVGIWSARISGLPIVWRGARMVLLGGAAILMGVIVGLMLPTA